MSESDSNTLFAKPFLKWAGGKRQLLDDFGHFYPAELGEGKIKKYFEPFVGGGAVLFNISQKFRFEDIFISDINKELILTYKTIKRDVDKVIKRLLKIQEQYLALNKIDRKDYFYRIREKFNDNLAGINHAKYQHNWINRTAQTIFLNRTCYNGLFRVNSKGEFNVPHGTYKNPKICDGRNLKLASSILQDVTINEGDFTHFDSFIDVDSFVYFDPPYRPISTTSSFTSYTERNFNNNEQLRLAKYFQSLDKRGAKLMLSNSDPKNINPNDNFFEIAYKGYSIQRVEASRNISSVGTGRGKISELVITNY